MNIQGENKSLELFNKKGTRVYEYYTYSFGAWFEYTYDEKENKLTYKDSNGSWHKYTYNKKGNKLTFKDSEGINTGFDIPEYTMENLVEKLGNFKLIN